MNKDAEQFATKLADDERVPNAYWARYEKVEGTPAHVADIQAAIRPMILAAIEWAYADAAHIARVFHDFGPSTECPNCHKSDHVLRCYTLGRDDTAKAIERRANG